MNKKLFKEIPMLPAVAFGISCSIIMSILLLLLNTTLIHGGNISIIMSNYLVLPIHAIATLVGCALSGRLAGERRSIVCALTAVGYLVLLILSALLYWLTRKRAMSST